MSSTIFISTDEIKSKTPIGRSVHDSLFEHNIDIAQDNHLKPILSQSLFDQIKAGIDTPPLSADDQILLDSYIKPYIAWKTYELSIEDFHSQVTDTGIVKRSSANDEGISVAEVKMKIDNASGKADSYKDKMLDFLFASDDYPEFNTTDTDERRSLSTNIAGIALRNSSFHQHCQCRNWPLCEHRTT